MELGSIMTSELKQEIERTYSCHYSSYSMEEFIELLLWRGLAHTEQLKKDREETGHV
ncbi:MAG: hypothetical protein II845_02200 [Oscillospiraceae bacterium]|nr:hypothetical protein [Oscillospiraceae bacterium]